MTNEKVKKLFDDIYSNKEKVITEELAKQVLSEYGVTVPKYALVKSDEEAEREVREYLVREGVVKEEVKIEEKVDVKEYEKTEVKMAVRPASLSKVFVIPYESFREDNDRFKRRKRRFFLKRRVALFDG